MNPNPYPDSLPMREAMRTPHKSRHTSARFTTRTVPARFRADDRWTR